MITVNDLELRAGARLLVDGVSFQLAAGDKIGLVGRNGAGKTTLLKVLAGEAQPAAGRCPYRLLGPRSSRQASAPRMASHHTTTAER